jgi:transposase
MKAEIQLKIDIIEKTLKKLISKNDAAAILNVSVRTIERYEAGFRSDGVQFFIHKNTERCPANKTDLETIAAAKKLLKEKYFDFNITHCLEKLSTVENIKINRETFRKECHSINMVKRRQRRRSKPRYLRQRTAQAGVFLQMDGSPHHWFNDEESCLIGAVDDATSENYYSEFFKSETTMGCLKVLKNIILKKGLFKILYVDKAGIFAGPKRADFSQVKRALAELNIRIIYANSAEAKGRIERHWETLQDRLVPEMRLKKIKSYAAANEYLNDYFLPLEYNQRFSVVPANLEPGWIALPKSINLDEIFCAKEPRVVASDHTISYEAKLYRITDNLKHSIKGQKVEVRKYFNEEIKFYFAGRILAVEIYERPIPLCQTVKIALVLDEKSSLKVRKDSHIFYQNKYYSVNPKYIGKQVNVTEHEQYLLFYYRKALIESHLKIKNHLTTQSTKPEHLKPWQATVLTSSPYRTAAREIGPDCDKLIYTILQKGQGVVDNKNIWGIIDLKKEYTKAALNEACGYAFSINSIGYRGVMTYLKLRYKKRAIS